MTHTETMAVLAALLSPEPETSPVGAGEREAALAHVARCSDCWTSLASLLEIASGALPSETARMAELYGCDRVQPDLYRLVGLDRVGVERAHPGAARHLGWCLACRGRLAELEAVERELAPPRWVEVVTRSGEAVREAVGRLVVRVGRATAGLAAVPDGFLVLAPALAPVPVRGTAEPLDTATLVGQSARFGLGDTGVTAELGVESEDDARVGLSLRLTSAVAEAVSVHVREMRPDGDRLVARHTLRSADPVVVHGLWPGSFLLELHRPEDRERYRVRVDIDPGA